MSGIVIGLSLLCGAWLGWPGMVLVALFSGIAMLLGERRSVLIGVAIVAAAIGAGRVSSVPPVRPPAWLDGATSVHGVVGPGSVDNGRAQRFEVVARQSGQPGQQAVRLCATGPVLPEISRGDVVNLSGSIRSLADVEATTARYLASRGCVGTIDVASLHVIEQGSGIAPWLDELRRSLTANIQSAAPGDAGALMAGLVSGDDASLSKERRDHFIVTGTSHVTAVSGSNLALIITMLAWFSVRAAGAHSRRWQIVALVAIWSYVGVIGLAPPPFRAACIATLATGAVWAGRRPDFLTLSVLVAAVEIVIRPADLDSLAFRLSTASGIAIVLALAGRTPNGALGKLRHSVFGTAAAQAATAPLLIPAFGRLTLFALPANLVVAPLCSAAFPISLAAGLIGFASPSIATVVAAPAAVICEIVLGSVGWIARWPGADAGQSLSRVLPAWAWVAMGVSVIVGISNDSRGGIARWYRVAMTQEPGRRAAIVGTAAGLLFGAMLALARG